MTYRKAIIATLICLVLFGLVTAVASAQGGNNGGNNQLQRVLNQVGRVIGPRNNATCDGGETQDPCNPLWDYIFIYPLFFVNMIAMMLQGDKELTPTLLLAVSVLCIVLAKLGPAGDIIPYNASNAEWLIFPGGLIWFVFNIGLFVLPLITAGMTKAKKSVGWAIAAGVWGGVYFFAFWFVAQRCAFGSCQML